MINAKKLFLSHLIIFCLLTTNFFALWISGAGCELTIEESNIVLTDGTNPMIGSLNLSQYEIEYGVVQKDTIFPDSPVEGQVFYYTPSSTMYFHNGTGWETVFGSGGGVSDHGALSGLTDDDHSQYVLEDGTRVMSGNLNMTQNEIVDGVFHSGSTPPASPVEGQWFYDTDDHTLYAYNGTYWINSVSEINEILDYEWQTSVTWGDDSTETVGVNDDGTIYLNETEVVAFGFHAKHGQQPGLTDDIANTILDRLQSDSVRFMTLNFAYWENYQNHYSDLQFWMPKLYAHKMFVMLQIQHRNEPMTQNVAYHYDKIETIIDYVCANSDWADMVFAMSYSWEMDLGYVWEGTLEDMEIWLAEMYPLVKSKLQGSLIGDVAAVVKVCAGGTKQDMMMEYTDVPSSDTYYYMANGDLDYSWISNYLSLLHSSMDAAGKGGMNLWYTEFGLRKTDPTPRNADFDKDKFEFSLSDGGYNDLSMMMIWILYNDEEWGWEAFNTDGTPKDWYLAIAPYFPLTTDYNTYQIASSADDSYMYDSESYYNYAHSYLATAGGSRSGFRWSLDIPASATITLARISVYTRSSEASGDVVRLQLFDEDNCSDFSSDFSGRDLMVGYYDQTMPITSDDTWINLGNITSLVQAFIDRAGYVEGNYLGICATIQSGSNQQAIDTYDSEGDHSTGAKLVITYTTP